MKKELITRTLTRVIVMVKLANIETDSIYTERFDIYTLSSPEKITDDFVINNAIIPAQTVLLKVLSIKVDTVKATWAIDSILPNALFDNEKDGE